MPKIPEPNGAFSAVGGNCESALGCVCLPLTIEGHFPIQLLTPEQAERAVRVDGENRNGCLRYIQLCSYWEMQLTTNRTGWGGTQAACNTSIDRYGILRN